MQVDGPITGRAYKHACVCVCGGGGGGGGKGRRGAYKRDFTVYQLHWNYLLSSAVADGEDGNELRRLERVFGCTRARLALVI